MGTCVMQQCLPNRAAGVIPVLPPPLCADGAMIPHRGLMLTGHRLGKRADLWLARRVLDRLLRPAALVEGVDLHLGDPWLAERVGTASGFVLLLPPVGNLSNPFYAVHPRRNDRFVAARDPLRALFPEVDFAPFAFTGHALGTLAATCPERFAEMRATLVRLWERRLRALLDQLPRHGALITVPQPPVLPQPLVARRGLCLIAADPDDPMRAAAGLASHLFAAKG